MNWKKWTIVFSLVIIVMIAAWDIWVTITPEQNDTISEQLVIYNKQFPFLGFALAVVFSHLGIQRTYWFGRFERHRYKFLLGSCSVALILAIIFSGWSAVLLFLVWGMITGLLFWPQYRENF